MTTCDEVRGLLDDYVDGVVAEEIAILLESHLAGCEACRREVELTREILVETARLSRGVEPARDLWPGIASRLEGSTVVQLRRRRPGRALVVGLAAVVLLGIAAVVLTGPAVRRSATAERPKVFSGVRNAATGAGDFTSEDDLARAARELRRALGRHGDGLSPDTVRVIEQNLDIIDDAIARVKRALDEEPGDRELVTLLAETYRRKIDLLQTATELSHTS